MAIRPKLDFPLTYRAEVVKPIMSCIGAGDSCSVVGIGSVGKTNLLRFLLGEDVRQVYLGDDWATYLFVYVDANKMLKKSLWGLLELMLHQLMVELTNYDVAEAIRQTIDDLHFRATQPKTRHLALRYLDRAIGIVCKQLGLTLVYLFDEFDDLCRKIPAQGFSALRALRDDNKYQLMYIVATRLELNRLRKDVSEIEAFEELTSPHTIWLGPYSDDDARFMLRRLENRRRLPLDDKMIDDLLLATGRHPGLLREVYHVVWQPQSNLIETLANNLNVQSECQRIWFSLTPEEQQVMVSIANGANILPYQVEVIERLRQRQLVGGLQQETDDQIFSPLLAEFIRQRNLVVGARLYLDHDRRTVWVNGHEVRGFTPLEFKLIAYLDQKPGQVCSRDELAQELYPDEMTPEGANVTDTRIDSVVKRLRKRIEPNPEEPQYIVTVRGHGFRLDNDGTEK